MKWGTSRLAVVVAVAIALVTTLVIASKLSIRSRWWLYRRYSHDIVQIEFYGKVVDQRGDPVPGAFVKANVTTADPSFLLGRGAVLQSVEVDTVTKDDGSFLLSGVRGRSIQIVEISRNGFISLPERDWMKHEELRRALVYYYSPSYGPPLVYFPTQARPAIFPLRKPNEPVASRPSRGGAPAGSVSVSASNNSVWHDGRGAVCLLSALALAFAAGFVSRRWHKCRRPRLALVNLALTASTAASTEPLEYRSELSPLRGRDATGIPDTKWRLDALGKIIFVATAILLIVLCIDYAIALASQPYQR